MKPFRWDPEKNDQLKEERGVSFEQVAVAMETGGLLQITPYQNQTRYPRQKIMVVKIDDYAYLVPFAENDGYFFLKTIIPSRKATRDLITKEDPDDKT